MTHVKQVESFARLLGFCSGYGGSYNPGRQTLQIDALVQQLNQVQSAMENVKIAKAEYDNEVNQRKQAFDDLPRLLSGILRTLEASGAKPEKLEDARSFVHQITGASPKNREPLLAEKPETPAAHRSRLQLAYVSKADTFSKLVKALSLPEGGVVACSSSPCGTDKNENKKTHHNIHALSEAFRGRQYAVMLLICL
jgi:uncharacterized protein YukE